MAESSTGQWRRAARLAGRAGRCCAAITLQPRGTVASTGRGDGIWYVHPHAPHSQRSQAHRSQRAARAEERARPHWWQ
jgi:hypothetical protein